MQGNKKYIGICLAAFVLLVGILAVKGIQAERSSGNEVRSGTVDAGTVSAGTGGSINSGPAVSDGEWEKEDRKESDGGESEQGKSSAEKPGSEKDDDKKSGSEKADVKKSGDKKSEDKRSGEQKSDKKGTGEVKGSKGEKNVKQTPSPTRGHKPGVTGKPADRKDREDKENREVTLCIDCTRILGRRDLWKKGIEEIIPSSGFFYSGSCSFLQGDSAYDVLHTVCKKNNIALDSQYTPIYGTHYIRGIGNLYEFDCGEESGWKYAVNGKTQVTGCSGYTVKPNDVITFYYDYRY